MDTEEIVEFVKVLEDSGLVKSGSHKSEGVLNSIYGIVSMTEEEHDEFQKEKPNQGVLMIFVEYQDWKETYKKD